MRREICCLPPAEGLSQDFYLWEEEILEGKMQKSNDLSVWGWLNLLRGLQVLLQHFIVCLDPWFCGSRQVSLPMHCCKDFTQAFLA